MKEERILLLPVEDSEDSQRAFDFMLKNIFREGDEVGLPVPYLLPPTRCNPTANFSKLEKHTDRCLLHLAACFPL